MGKNDHLIDDTGVHANARSMQSAIFVTLCRVVTAVLALLGLAALIPYK